MGDNATTEIPISMMLEPPYICQPHDDSKDFVTQFLENEKALESCLAN